MYLDYYGLREPPFAITPDPRFVYLSERHREALAHLRYGIAQGGSGGFVLLTGDIGTGKTTLSRLLLEQLPDGTQAALLLNPRVSALELLQSLCDELKVDVDPSTRNSTKSLVDALNAHLLGAHARGGEVVVLLDEAQNLSTEALEQVRLLTNLETPTAKLLQIVLLGQPELREVLARADLAQLAQRITARYHLGPLDPHETGNYLRHRLAVAGSKRFPFSAAAVRALHARSGGVPRRINIVADRALTGAYAQQANDISVDLVQRAADEALGETSTRRRPWFALAVGVPLMVAVLALALSASRRPAAALQTPAAAARHPMPAPSSRDRAAASGAATPWAKRAAGAMEVLAQPDERVGPLLRDDAAWQRLLGEWSIPAALGAAGCRTELASGMYCLEGVGSLERLRRLGAPVLTTVEFDGAQRQLLLVAIDDDALTFAASHGVRAVARDAFEQRWLGQFRAAWRVPGDLPPTLAQGAKGASVEWLERALVAARIPVDSMHRAGRYDVALVDAVRNLQRRFGLLEDGIVGRETQWILASRLAAADGDFAEPLPRLSAPPPRPLDSQPSRAD